MNSYNNNNNNNKTYVEAVKRSRKEGWMLPITKDVLLKVYFARDMKDER